MKTLIERCAQWAPILTLDLEKLGQASDLPSATNFEIETTDGARVIGLGGASHGVKFGGSSKVAVDGEGSTVVVGEGATLISAHINISGKRSHVIIGPNCVIRKVELQIKGDDCLIVIGAGTTWEAGAAICDSARAIVIGDDCMFSSNVVLRVSDGHSIWDAGGTQRISTPKDVVINPHVWLGNGARVSKGAVIGMGTTVGQGAIVTGRLKAYAIYGGIPARLIRANSEWSRSNKYHDIPEQFRFKKQA